MKNRLFFFSPWLLAAALSLLPSFGRTQVNASWIKRYAGTSAASVDIANGLVVDPSGRVYVTGESGGNYCTIRYNNSDGSRVWTKTFNGTGNGVDVATDIATDASGNVYVTGRSTGSGSGLDFLTIKYDKYGSAKWTKRYTGPGNASDIPSDIAVDGSGNVYVTGSTDNGSTSLNDYLTIKYDKDGNRKWTRIYNGPKNGRDVANALTVDGSGNLYVTGHINAVPNEDNENFGDIGTIKYNTSGVQQWVAIYNNNTNDGGSDIAVDGSGSVYVTGFSARGDEDPDAAWTTVKYDASGVLKWDAHHSGPGHVNGSYARALALDKNANVYVTGFIEDVDFSDADIATIKYNTNGVRQWVATFDNPLGTPNTNSHDLPFNIAVDGYGNVYVTGRSTGATSGWDYITLKYNTSGAQQWVQRFNGTGNADDQANALGLDGDGNVFVTGQSTGLGTGNDFLSIKYKQTPVIVKTNSYLELNNLVVVYRHTNGGDIPDNYATGLNDALAVSKLFYWRHSHMGLNIKWTVFVINDYLPRVRENGYVFPAEVDADLKARGFTVGSYDAVVAVVRGGGAYAWGVNQVLGKGGYCQVPWWEDKLLFPWFIVHEFHHVVDAMYANAGHGEYPHNHPGAARALGEFVPHSGTGWDLNREIMQNWQRPKWFELRTNGNWGTDRTFTDNDLDTVPDNDATLALDEARLGSSASNKDTDGDGLSDLQEAMAGIFTAANPLGSDSDGDGVPDATDTEPIYPLATKVPAGTGFTLDQDVAVWPLSGHYFFDKADGASSSLHLASSASNLYVGFKILTGLKQVEVWIDANNDGLFYGNDNIEVRLSGNTITAVNLYDAAAVPPGNQSDFIVSSLPVTGFSGVSRAGTGWSSYQLILPKLSQYGLALAAGETIGVYINVQGYGSMLEPDDYLTVTLGESVNSITKLQANTGGSSLAERGTVSPKLSAVAFPSPFTGFFSLQWSGGNGPVSITITDALGRFVERRTNLAAAGTLQTGHSLRPGIYYAQVVQETKRVVVKLIKN
jgi:hypothetical protein